MKRCSLRARLTLISVALLLVCCLGLTLVLNHAAGNMADAIEALPILPAATVGQEDWATVGEAAAAMPAAPSAASQEARDLFSLQSWLWMLLVVAIGGLATWFVTGKALRPLGKLSQEMESRTVETLSRELPIPESRDEIASLTQSFNAMSRKLDASFSAQKRFAQSAAHELRTPLTVLRAKVDVFRKRPTHTPEEVDALLTLVGTQTDRMAALVNDLLGLTNLDEPERGQTVDLSPLLAEVVQELSPLAVERSVTVSLDAAACRTVGNPNLLHRVFANLVENAVKYNGPDGTVAVTATVEGDQCVVQVADTGPGIPEDQKALIFEPFYRVDKSRSRRMGGAGLGLATVKAVLDKHGGTVTVGDAPEGGSVFTVRLKAI